MVTAGLAEPSSTRAQLRAGLSRCIATVPAPLLDAHIMGTEPPAAVEAVTTAAGSMLSAATGGSSSAGAATIAADDAAASAAMHGSPEAWQGGGSGAGGDGRSNGWHDAAGDTSCQQQASPPGQQAMLSLGQQAMLPLQQRDYRLVTPKVTALAQTLLLYKVTVCPAGCEPLALLAD